MEINNKLRKLVLTAAAISVIILIPLAVSLAPEDIVKVTPKNTFAAAVVVILVFTLKNILMMLPLKVMYIVCGMCFGAVWGIVIAYIGLICEISVGYWIGSRLGTQQVVAVIAKRPKAGNIHDLVKGNPRNSCFLSRIIPMPFPVDIVSMYFGASGVNFSTYLAFSLLGFTGKLLPYVIAGKSVTSPLSPEFLIPLSIGLTVSIITFLIQRKFQKRGSQRKLGGEP